MSKPVFDRAHHARRMEWFNEARFGMFIHWGIYSIPARGEWYRSHAKMKKEDYHRFFEEFNPTHYDPKAWAKAAKDAGMKYAVITTKHHDGFCLFDSALTDFKATNTKAGRDLIKEYVDAFRAEGLKIGFYYSTIDWHHPHYQVWGDQAHPHARDEAYKDYQFDFDIYLEYMHGQVKELMTNYGKIDILWFDYSYDNLQGEAWKATELVKMIRTHQPDIILNDRLEGTGNSSLKRAHTEYFSGDFMSPEQLMPPKGMFDEEGRRIPWEACVTMNMNWGYVSREGGYKSSEMLVRKLVECVSKGGNLLLNVGPDSKGRIPKPSLERLAKVGEWMELHSESIYGCGYGDLPKPDFGRITRKGNKVYVHIVEPTIGPAPLIGIPLDTVERVRRLDDGSELHIVDDFRTQHYKDTTFVYAPGTVDADNPVLVIEVTLKENASGVTIETEGGTNITGGIVQ